MKHSSLESKGRFVWVFWIVRDDRSVLFPMKKGLYGIICSQGRILWYHWIVYGDVLFSKAKGV